MVKRSLAAVRWASSACCPLCERFESWWSEGFARLTERTTSVQGLRHQQGHYPFSRGQSLTGPTGAEAGKVSDRGVRRPKTGCGGRRCAPPLTQWVSTIYCAAEGARRVYASRIEHLRCFVADSWLCLVPSGNQHPSGQLHDRADEMGRLRRSGADGRRGFTDLGQSSANLN